MTKRKNGRWEVAPGDPLRQGVTVVGDQGVNFAFAADEGSTAELILTDQKGKEKERIPLPDMPEAGNMRAVYIKNIKPRDIFYRVEIDGSPYVDPLTKGIRGDISYVPDPCYDWEGDVSPKTALQDLAIYKMHVRGFTMAARRGVRHRGTFAGVAEKIPYIAGLGFNAVEFLPMYDWQQDLKIQPFSSALGGEEGQQRAEPLKNYWGYANTNYYFAPKPEYAATKEPADEVRDLVKALHREGIAVIMEFYFPQGTDPWRARHAVRFWKTFYHVDGFHFIGEGVPKNMLKSDPVLARTYLIFERADCYESGKPGSKAKKHILECSADFMRTGRCLLKSDEGCLQEFARLIKRNPECYGVVNYMAGVNGFTLLDTVSYDRRHNEANGENNADGSAENYSWNCGIEGPTQKNAVKKLRMRQIRNALAYTFLAQGVPLLMAGDECLNTQDGNNNAYASDNPTGWKSWSESADARELAAFAAKLMALRKAHPIFHMSAELRGTDYRGYGCPDLSFHDTEAWVCSFENSSRTLAVLYNGRYTLTENLPADDLFLVCYNAHWEKHEFALPPLHKDMKWYPVLDTALARGEEFAGDDAAALADQRFVSASPRSVLVLRGCVSPENAATEPDPKEEDKSGGAKAEETAAPKEEAEVKGETAAEEAAKPGGEAEANGAAEPKGEAEANGAAASEGDAETKGEGEE